MRTLSINSGRGVGVVAARSVADVNFNPVFGLSRAPVADLLDNDGSFALRQGRSTFQWL